MARKQADPTPDLLDSLFSEWKAAAVANGADPKGVAESEAVLRSFEPSLAAQRLQDALRRLSGQPWS